jgi:hypothetical protein
MINSLGHIQPQSIRSGATIDGELVEPQLVELRSVPPAHFLDFGQKRRFRGVSWITPLLTGPVGSKQNHF